MKHAFKLGILFFNIFNMPNVTIHHTMKHAFNPDNSDYSTNAYYALQSTTQ